MEKCKKCANSIRSLRGSFLFSLSIKKLLMQVGCREKNKEEKDNLNRKILWGGVTKGKTISL